MILITGNNSPTFLSEKCSSATPRAKGPRITSGCVPLHVYYSRLLFKPQRNQPSLSECFPAVVFLIFVFCVLKGEAVTPEALSDQKLSAAVGGQHLHKKSFFLRSQVKMRAERSRRGLNGASQLYFYSETQKVSSPIHTFNKHMAANTGPEK